MGASAQLPTNLTGGGAFLAELLSVVNRMARMLNNVRFFGGHADVSERGIYLYGAAVSTAFSGTAYVCGKKTTGLTSNAALPWIKVDVEARTATQQAGPPSDPFPANEEWFLKSQTAGDVHVSRL